MFRSLTSYHTGVRHAGLAQETRALPKEQHTRHVHVGSAANHLSLVGLDILSRGCSARRACSRNSDTSQGTAYATCTCGVCCMLKKLGHIPRNSIRDMYMWGLLQITCLWWILIWTRRVAHPLKKQCRVLVHATTSQTHSPGRHPRKGRAAVRRNFIGERTSGGTRNHMTLHSGTIASTACRLVDRGTAAEAGRA